MPGDRPIEKRSQDRLGRAVYASKMAAEIRRLNASQGMVIGLFGPWGAGKTSVLNMIAEALAEEPAWITVRFEPWLFSGAGELLSLFFADLARQLKLRQDSGLSKVAGSLEAYGEMLDSLGWVPIAGTWASRVGKLGKLIGRPVNQRREKARELPAQRETLIRELSERETPIVVILDDIDRLQPSEIHDILRLVRLTGQFPQVVYVLAMDRARVEKVLSEPGFEGRDYLEKIIEVAHDLPAVSVHALYGLLGEELDTIVSSDPRPVDTKRWSTVFYKGIAPLFANLRDVHRYLAVLPATLATIGGEVAFTDVLALEALRVLQPDAHAMMATCAWALANGSPDPTQRIIDAAEPRAHEAVAQLCRLLFPAVEQHLLHGRHYDARAKASWRRDGRVADITVFGFYLARVLDPWTVPATDFEQILAALGDPQVLWEKLTGVSPAALADVLERLEAYEHDYPLDAVEPAASVLMRLYLRVRRTQDPFDTGGDLQIDRVLRLLLRRIDDREELAGIVERLTASPGCLYGLMQMTLIVSREPETGDLLISGERADQQVAAMWLTIRHADAQTLLSDHSPLRLLHQALRDDLADRGSLDEQLEESPALTAALLRDAVDVLEASELGTAASNRQPILQWEALLRVFDGPDRLRDRIEALRSSGEPTLSNPATVQALDLVERSLRSAPRRQWAEPVARSESALFRPHDLPGPTAATPPGGRAGEADPELVLRAVCLYSVNAERAERTNLLDAEVHGQLLYRLEISPATVALNAFCTSHDLPTEDDLAWAMEPSLNVAHAAARARFTRLDSPVHLAARGAIHAPGLRAPHVAVITDISIGRTSAATGQASEASAAPMFSLRETRDLLSAALATSASFGQSQLPGIFDDYTLPYAGTELHVASRRGGAASLTDLIDLRPLGTPSKGSPPGEGSYATKRADPLDTAEARDDLVNRALRYMAGPVWTYASAEQRLLDLLNPEPDIWVYE